MKKYILLAFTIILPLILASCSVKKDAEDANSTPNQQEQTDTEENKPDNPKVKAIIKDNKIFTEHKNKNDNSFFVDIDYPTIENENDNSSFKKINESLINFAEFLEGDVNWFTEEFESDSNEYPENLSYVIKYNIAFQNDEYLSISFTLDTYLGGAHPDSIPYGKTYDLITGEEVTLDKIFNIPEEEYKNIMLDYIFIQTKEKYDETDNVAENLDEDQLKESIRPDSFYLKDNNLVIFFYSYDFLCYAVGNQEFFIPFDDIKDKLTIELLK